MRKFSFFSLLLILIMLLGVAFAQTAQDITTTAEIIVTSDTNNLTNLLDGNYRTVWRSKRGYVQFDLPEPCYGIYLTQSGETDCFTVEVRLEDDTWSPVYHSKGEYLHEFVCLSGVTSLRVIASGQGMLTLNGVHLYGKGDVPDDVQRWETLDKNADLMLISAHPDDEYIWFGGTIPTYAGERQMKVQLVYFCFGQARRKNELLDGLWTCGVRYYPVIGEYKDEMHADRQSMYRIWGGTKTVFPWLTTIIREYQPDVILTHDLNGEYGHGAHQVAAMASIQCIEKAAMADYDAASYALYGTWQVKKLYLHLYAENEIEMDWHIPLEAFSGMTGLEVAQLGLDKHVSQRAITYKMLESGPYDCRKFGLYMTTVGADVQKNDFFEHIMD